MMMRSLLNVQKNYKVQLQQQQQQQLQLFSTASNIFSEYFSSFGGGSATTKNDPSSSNSSSRSTLTPNTGKNNHLAQEIAKETEQILTNTMLPINESVLGPLEKYANRRTPMPFVFLLGNHSSGKSTFVNFLLGRKVQETGVAPTDDGFTVIAPGNRDYDQDGPSFVGTEDMGFQSLRQLGPSLINHMVLKVRSDLKIKGIMLVDSPGMIDSPTDSNVLFSSSLPGGSSSTTNTLSDKKNISGRGYDFVGAVRWLAERADVILLFFDPDKPGTTGETLSVLTSSLMGLDHKLHIILNKVDTTNTVHDFARSYGSLCWNLSKVIPRKDLPRIYTMCTPVAELNIKSSNEEEKEKEDGKLQNQQEQSSFWAASRQELEATRTDVINEVNRAPERRVDNMITQLYDSARLLQIHMIVLDRARSDFFSERVRMIATSAGIGFGGNAFSIFALMNFPEIWGFAATLSVCSALGAGGMYLWGVQTLDKRAKEMKSIEYLDSVFRRTHLREIVEKDEYVTSLWIRVRPQIQAAVETLGPLGLRKIQSRDLKTIRNVAEIDVPRLRKKASIMTSTR